MKKPFVTPEQLQEIAKDYPTPFHLYDERGIRENARALYKAFSWNPGFKEYFAVKATPTPAILKLLREEGCGVDWIFSKEPLPGDAAVTLTVPFSNYKTGYFTYDAETNRYWIEQHINGKDVPYVDGAGGEPVGVSNVLVLYTDVGQVKGDEAGRMSVRTTGEGEGILLRDGRVYEITWSREKRTDSFRFLGGAGQPVPLAVGPSYINIVGTSAKVVWE